MNVPHVRLETRQECLLSQFLVNPVVEIVASAIKQEKEVKDIHIEMKK